MNYLFQNTVFIQNNDFIVAVKMHQSYFISCSYFYAEADILN